MGGEHELFLLEPDWWHNSKLSDQEKDSIKKALVKMVVFEQIEAKANKETQDQTLKYLHKLESKWKSVTPETMDATRFLAHKSYQETVNKIATFQDIKLTAKVKTDDVRILFNSLCQAEDDAKNLNNEEIYDDFRNQIETCVDGDQSMESSHKSSEDDYGKLLRQEQQASPTSLGIGRREPDFFTSCNGAELTAPARSKSTVPPTIVAIETKIEDDGMKVSNFNKEEPVKAETTQIDSASQPPRAYNLKAGHKQN